MKLSQLDKGTRIAFNVLAMVAMDGKANFWNWQEEGEETGWTGKKLEHN